MQIGKISITRKFGADNNQTVDIGQTEIPENYMLDARKLVGDGLARITVSADMALKEFGSGAGAMVSVSLTCNQDQDTIEKTIDLAGTIARQYAVEQHKLAEEELKASRPQQPKY